MTTIDDVYKLVRFVSNKSQNGNVTPADFNHLATVVQLEIINDLIGNNQNLNQAGVPPYGYQSNRRIHESLRPLVYGPIDIPIRTNGEFEYPYGYIWPDSVSKSNYDPFAALLFNDQYPHIKRSTITSPTEDYPVLVWRNPYGFVDPYNIGSFKMSYVKRPPNPYWAYDVVNDDPVWNQGLSVDFSVADTFTLTRIAMKILQYVGINLSAAEVTQFSMIKNKEE